MSRSQQNQTFNTAQGENQTYNTNAQQAFDKAQQGVTGYGSQLAKFASSNPYVQGGQYQTVQNQELADTANAGANATKQAIEGASVRTGANLGGAVAGAQEVAQQNQRTMGTQEAQANAQRIASEAGYNQTSLGGYQTEQQMQDQLAAQQAGAAQNALGTQEQAANTPSFTDMLGQGLISAGSSFAAGYGSSLCPAEGSLMLMADGTRKRIETLTVGEKILGIDMHPQTIQMIVSATVPLVAYTGTDGFKGRSSRSHALMLSTGGFTAAEEADGAEVCGFGGPILITSVKDAGIGPVFNIVTDGGHTYNADGFWALGMSLPEIMAGTEQHQQFAEGVR